MRGIVARPLRNRPKVRLNLDMPEEIKERLDNLRELTNADSMSEVIRRALAVYDFLWQEKDDGADAIIRYKDGSEKHLKLL